MVRMPQGGSIAGPQQDDVALFIDWENLKYSLQQRNREPSISGLVEAIASRGRLVIARAYADWLDRSHIFSQDQRHLYISGIEPVYVPASVDPLTGERRKNSIDVKMSTDCMEVSFTNDHINTFVLVSGDADFLHIASSLRSRGNRVIMIGVSWSTSNRFAEAVDDLVYYDKEIDPVEAPVRTSDERSGRRDPRIAIERMVEIVKDQRKEGGRAPLLSWLGLQMRKDENFSPQAYGFEKLKDLVRYAEEQGRLKIVTRDLVDWVLLPDDPVPPEAMDDSDGDGSGNNDNAAQSQQRLSDFPEVEADIVKTMDELEQNRRNGFVTPGWLGHHLWKKGRFDPESLPRDFSPPSDTLKTMGSGQIRRFIEQATQMDYLIASWRHDPISGKEFEVIQLNRSNPQVQKILEGQ